MRQIINVLSRRTFNVSQKLGSETTEAVFLRYSRELYNETALFPKRLGRLLDKPCDIGI